jgi:hypothetical protein
MFSVQRRRVGLPLTAQVAPRPSALGMAGPLLPSNGTKGPFIPIRALTICLIITAGPMRPKFGFVPGRARSVQRRDWRRPTRNNTAPSLVRIHANAYI